MRAVARTGWGKCCGKSGTSWRGGARIARGPRTTFELQPIENAGGVHDQTLVLPGLAGTATGRRKGCTPRGGAGRGL